MCVAGVGCGVVLSGLTPSPVLFPAQSPTYSVGIAGKHKVNERERRKNAGDGLSEATTYGVVTYGGIGYASVGYGGVGCGGVAWRVVGRVGGGLSVLVEV